MKLDKWKDILIIFLLVILVLTISYLILTLNKNSQISERDSYRLKSQLSDGKKGSDKDVDPYEKNEVKNTILKGAADKIQNCYKDWIKKNPQFTFGKVVLDWQIELDGRVKKPEIISSDIVEINTCVIDAIAVLKFPPPPSENPWYVVHKFFFKKEDSESAK
jgi:hypothetical protein